MSASMYFHGYLEPLDIRVYGEDATIWIRTPNQTLALTLTAVQCDMLEAAIAEVRNTQLVFAAARRKDA